jgi:hypothetical protein
MTSSVKKILIQKKTLFFIGAKLSGFGSRKFDLYSPITMKITFG